MRVVIAGMMMLLAAAPAAEPKNSSTTCKGRCQIQYKACLKRTTIKKGRAQCKVQRDNCQRTCR